MCSLIQWWTSSPPLLSSKLRKSQEEPNQLYTQILSEKKMKREKKDETWRKLFVIFQSSWKKKILKFKKSWEIAKLRKTLLSKNKRWKIQSKNSSLKSSPWFFTKRNWRGMLRPRTLSLEKLFELSKNLPKSSI